VKNWSYRPGKAAPTAARGKAEPAAPAETGPQSCSLELRRLEVPKRGGGNPAAEIIARLSYPQSFFVEVAAGQSTPTMDEGAARFREIVKHEPRYVVKCPLRSVARLGAEEYAFALDAADPRSNGYDVMYFDLNRDGDLTNDKVIRAQQGSSAPGGHSRREFPRVDLPLTIDGAQTAYSFFVTADVHSGRELSYASASLVAGAYREGKIVLGGKRRQLVLLDRNCNGRFDDEIKVSHFEGNPTLGYGDTLLVDPDPSLFRSRSAADIAAAGGHYVSKLIGVDGRFYELQVTPAGDKLTFTPSAAPIGYVSNPCPGFRALVYNDQAVVSVSRGRTNAAPLPEGQWRLASYTIDLTGYSGPLGPGPRGSRNRAGTSLSTIVPVSSAPLRGPGSGQVLLSARATKDCKAIEVRGGETVALPFGPPYRPVVKASRGKAGTVSLSLTLVGASGEVCTNLELNGGHPPGPEFVIATSQGQVVEHGKFEFG
jgi:hypothetical protein